MRLLRRDWELGQRGHKAHWAAGGAVGGTFSQADTREVGERTLVAPPVRPELGIRS